MDRIVALLPERAQERWLPVVGWEGLYEVSSWGRVKSLVKKQEHILRPRLCGAPGKRKLGVTLCANGAKKGRDVHRLVLEAFIGSCPETMECRHGRGGPFDNSLANLQWGTASDNNSVDKYRDGTALFGERNHRAVLSAELVVRIYETSGSDREIAEALGVSRVTVTCIKNGTRWRHLLGERFKPRTTKNRGRSNRMAKLTEKEALEIYAASGSQSRIAREYGVAQTLVSQIKRKKIWKWLHELEA